MHDAKTQLSRLVDRAARGEPFVIANAGKPLVKVAALDVADVPVRRRIGCLAGRINVPDDFDRMGAAHLARLFDTAA